MGACNSANHTKPQSTAGLSDTSKAHNGQKPFSPNSTASKPPKDQISPLTKYDDVHKYYKLGVHRGSGSFGIVREAEEITTGQKYAIKTVWKAQFIEKKQFIINEIEILLQIDHDNIIRCYQIYEDNHCIHFVFDLIEGGDLFDYLISCPKKIIPENRAVDFFNQILDALQYLHEKNIIHRDIKPENFLIVHSGTKFRLKLIDFGFAGIIREGQKLTDKVGSLQYIAPEMFKEDSYDNKIDMWAAGVVLYNMLTGKHPFSGKVDNEVMNNILNSEPSYSDSCFSFHAKTLCANLLNKNPNERFNASEAKMSMWIQNFLNADLLPTLQGAKFQPSEENIKNILSLLNQKSNVKTEIYNILLSYLSIDTINSLKDKLTLMIESRISDEKVESSIDGKYSIPYKLLLDTVLEHFCTDEELKTKLNEILETKGEICSSQYIIYKDYLERLVKSKVILVKERVWNIFKELDKKGVGYITHEQMCFAFKEYFPKYDGEKMKEFTKMSIVNDKNNIKFEEFLKFYEKFSTIIQ